MTSGKLGTQLGPTHAQDNTRAAAARYLKSTDNADLLPVLGLTDDEKPVRPACPTCGHPLSKGKHGGYRRLCQRKTCTGGAEL